MPPSKILIFFSIAIYSTRAEIPYDDVELNLFSKQTRVFELNVLQSTQIAKSFFDRDDVSIAIAIGTIGLEFVPYIGRFARLIPLMRDTVGDRSEWRTQFTKAIADEKMNAITESENRWMEATMLTIQSKIKLLGEDNPDLENRKTIASIIHTDFDKMINLFDLKSSLFRKYPLLGAPPLIQLATLITIFNPIANALIPFEANNSPISCKMLDVLLDYRPIVVNARLHKIYTEMATFQSIVDVMSLPYNPNGYNDTNPGVIDCEIGCTNRILPVLICLKDKFGKEQFLMEREDPECLLDYAKLIRYRIEELFPVELLNNMCGNREPRQPTGEFYKNISSSAE